MINILLIEDDTDDVELLEDAFKNQDIAFTMEVLKNGSEAIDHIRTCVVCPDVIVMDLNLPKVHGREILKEIKTSAQFKEIPLAILTTSSSKDDMDYARQLGVDSYMVKPTTLETIKRTVITIAELASGKQIPGTGN